MEEDKRQIVNALIPVLQMTRQCFDLVDLEYSGHLANGDENVTAFFMSGGRQTISVTADSGIAMIIDIAKGML